MDDVRPILQEVETGWQPKRENVADCNPSTRFTVPSELPSSDRWSARVSLGFSQWTVPNKIVLLQSKVNEIQGYYMEDLLNDIRV
jgi:hypothetical protein